MNGDSDTEDEHLQTALFAALCTPEPQPEPTPTPLMSPGPEAIQPTSEASVGTSEANFEELFEILRRGFPGSEPESDSRVQEPRREAEIIVEERPREKSPRIQLEQPSGPRKRPRLNGVKTLAIAPETAAPGPPPPEKVQDAYRLLELSLSATRKEVQRKFRVMARHWHPDKAVAEQRVRSTRMFRELQEAKGLILSWLDQRSIPLEESEDSFCFDTEDEFDEDALRPPEVLLGEAGDVMAEFENDGSDSELERDELKAAGVHRARGDSPASQSSSEGSGDEKVDTALALQSRGIIRSQDAPLVQATTLSHFMSRKSTAAKRCSECFSNKVMRGSELCASCDQEHRELQRFLGRADSGEKKDGTKRVGGRWVEDAP